MQGRRISVALVTSCALAISGSARAQAPAQVADTSHPTVRLTAEPTVIGPGVISTQAEEFKATVSPDGGTLLYVVTDHQFRHMTIVEAHQNAQGWATPEVATFSGVWRDGDPSFAPDGRTLVFISNRPFPNESQRAPRRNFNIWHIGRRDDGTWTDAAPYGPAINTETNAFAPSLTATGILYFNRGDVIYRAEPFDDGFRPPQALPFHGSDPGISPDERFIVFDAVWDQQNHSNLFVSCRLPDGWTQPRRFLEPVNSDSNDGDPSVSPDGHWLFFYSQRAAPAPDRAPRAKRPTYADVEQEAVSDIYNGSRNLYQVDLSSFSCENLH